MKLAKKLTFAITLGILLVLSGNALIRVQREIALFESDSRRDNQLLGRTLAGTLARIWPVVGEDQALDLVEDANQRESNVRIRWVWLGDEDAGALGPEVQGARLAELASGGELALRVAGESDASDELYTYIPVSIPGDRAGAIEVRDSLLSEREYVRRTLLQAFIATAALVALCGSIAIGFVYGFVGKPVATLIAQAKRIGSGDLTQRPPFDQDDEIGQLGREMNTMCDLLLRAHETADREATARIAALEQLRHADRLSTVGQLAAGIAHELGTPLSVVAGRAQLISRDHGPESDTYKGAAIVLEQTGRMTAIIRQLLDFARRREPRKASEPVGDLVLQTVHMLGSLAKSARVTIVVDEGENVRAEVDAGQLQQAITNLVVNAVQAMPDGGRISIAVSERTVTPPVEHGDPEGTYVVIAVGDEGIGMTPEERSRAFEPFFTTKPSGQGTGLGLSVAYGIVQEHRGWIDVQSVPNEGSSFTIYLPGQLP